MDCVCLEILLISLCCFHGTLDGRHLQNYNVPEIKTNAIIFTHRSQRDLRDIESKITFPDSEISDPATISTEKPENRNIDKTNYEELDESRIVFPDDDLPRFQKNNTKNDEITSTINIETSTVNYIPITNSNLQSNTITNIKESNTELNNKKNDISNPSNTKTELSVNNLPITNLKFQDNNIDCIIINSNNKSTADIHTTTNNDIICKSTIESISSSNLNYSPELKPIDSVIGNLPIENANLFNNAISNIALNNISIEESTIKVEDGTILQSSISNIPISNSNLQNYVIVSAPTSNASIKNSSIAQYSYDIGSAISNVPILNSTIQNSVIKSTPVASLNLSNSIITSKVPLGNAISEIKISNSQLQGLNIVSNPKSQSTISDSIIELE